MIVTIDVDKMFKLGITPNEYLLLQMIQNRALVSAKKLVDRTPELTTSTLDKLVEKRLIHNSNHSGEFDTTRIMLRNKWIGEIKKDSFFDELVRIFPSTVIRPDGIKDYLKTDLNKCRRLYTQNVKKDEVVHNEIMECLKLEIRERQRTGKMSYMKRLPNWISSEEWTAWKAQMDESSTETIDLGYGLKLE